MDLPQTMLDIPELLMIVLVLYSFIASASV
jgi:hypothetical protein